MTGAAFVGQSDELSENLSDAIDDIKGWLDDTPVNEELADQIRETANSAGPAVSEGVGSSAVSLLESAFGFVTGLILGTIVLYYLLKDLPTLGANFLAKQEDADGHRHRRPARDESGRLLRRGVTRKIVVEPVAPPQRTDVRFSICHLWKTPRQGRPSWESQNPVRPVAL